MPDVKLLTTEFRRDRTLAAVPFEVTTLVEEVIHEARIEIVAAADDAVVTVVEILESEQQGRRCTRTQKL